MKSQYKEKITEFLYSKTRDFKANITNLTNIQKLSVWSRLVEKKDENGYQAT